MKPYYEHGRITIYHGDCREIAPSLPVVDLLLADPPYGMRYVPMRGADGSKRWDDRKGVAVLGDDARFEPAWMLRDYKRLCLWGAQWYAGDLPASGGWLVWNKIPKGRKDGFHAGDCDLAWTNIRTSTRLFPLQWGGEARDGEPFFHPTQKPVVLMGWCIDTLGCTGLVLDPYCGSGPTLAAAKLRNIPAIGIEIEETVLRDRSEAAQPRVSRLRAATPPCRTHNLRRNEN